MFGLAPANYSMAGSPAGLARIDKLFGLDMYTSNFTASPLVFGAFPSLHAGSATIEALFLSHVFPKLRPFFIGYTLWIWWATMYLSHHYAVDLVGGSLCRCQSSRLSLHFEADSDPAVAGVVFYVAKSKFLPRTQPGKSLRWDYDYVEIGDVTGGNYYGLADFDAHLHRHGHLEGDEWAVGSSSSIASGTISPVDEIQSMWDGETIASQSDSDGFSGHRR